MKTLQARLLLVVSIALLPALGFLASTEISAHRTGLILLLGCAVWALAMTALLGAGLIRRPIQRMITVADRWQIGDLPARSGLREDGSESARLADARDRMAAAHEARELALRTALESTTDCVAVFDRAWRITYLNQHAKALTPGRDLVGQVLWDAHPGLAQTAFGEAYRTAMDGGAPIHFEAYDEPLKAWFDVHAYPSSEGLTLFFRDVTNERAVAARLAEREQMLIALGEATPDLLYAKDRCGRTLYANPTTLAVLGCTAEDLLGRTAAEFLSDPVLAEAFMADDRRIMAGGETERIEEDVLDARTGEIRVWQTNKTPLRHRDTGEVIGIAGISRDVTEERRTAAALSAERARLGAIYAAAPVGLSLLDTDLRVRTVNERLSAINGVSPADLVGRTLGEVLPNIADTVEPIVRQVLTTGEAVDGVEITGETPAAPGKRRTWLASYQPVRVGDAVIGVGAAILEITDRKAAEDALRESEARFHQIADAAPVLIWMSDTARNCTWFNQPWLDFTGRTMEQELGYGWAEGVHPEDFDRCVAVYNAAFDQRLPFRMDYRLRRADGEWRTVDDSGVPRFTGDGAFLGYIGSLVDFTEARRAEAALRHLNESLEARIAARTADLAAANEQLVARIEERKLAEAAVRKSEQFFRATFDQSAVGMAHTHPDGTWLRVNDRLCAITGYTREELLASTFQDITHPADLAADIAQSKALLAGEIASFMMEKRYLHKDGSAVWANLTVALVRDADGRPDRFLSVIEDISERKRTEAALQESETRLQLAREASGLGIWDRDLATDTAIWSNDVWRLYGREPQPVCPDCATWLASVHPDDRARAQNELEASIADPGRSFDIEFRVVWPDGTVHWLLSMGQVVRSSSGEPLRIVGLSMDMTEDRETEAALRRLTGQLEARVHEEVAAREAAQTRAAHAERMQALGRLAGGIAHDFNNVLQAIAGASALIERRPNDEANVRRMARIAIAATERGASVTGRLLAFGRRADLCAGPLDAAALLGSIREVLAHTLGAGIEVRVRAEADLPPMLADKGQLETVLVNLATNARDAMPDGGRLTLFAATETVPTGGSSHRAGLASGRYVRVTVTDNGVGMDAATLARVGEPFFTTKQPGAGTGLGLSMAKGFAGQSGGALSIESSPGKGTAVTLWLPEAGIDRALGSVDVAASRPHQAARSGRVLLVDDEDMVREIIAAFLEDAGFETLVAANGTEAIALLAAGEAVDIVVTDFSMPNMDGLAVIRAAHELRPGLPAVLLTGYASDERALAGDGTVSGTFSLLRKPVKAAQLLDLLDARLGRDGGDA